MIFYLDVNMFLNFDEWQNFVFGDELSIAYSYYEGSNLLYAEGQRKYVELSQPMIDVKGNEYSGIISLEPWSGLVLLGDGEITEIN